MQCAPAGAVARRRQSRASGNAARRDRNSPECEQQKRQRREQDEVRKGGPVVTFQVRRAVEPDEEERAGRKAKPEGRGKTPKHGDDQSRARKQYSKRLEDAFGRRPA